MKRIRKAGALLLALLLLLSTAVPAMAAETAAIFIQTAGDLTALAKSCSLDVWSQGKTVVLTADIDLTGVDVVPIPTFGGTFDGGGHTISGLSLTGSGSAQGLFRYIQERGVVRDLTVEGTVAPGGTKSAVGGIAGNNRGLITGCTFRGTVKGRNNVGGVVGVNEGTGRLIACAFSGGVSGEHYVGGVAGQNLGSLVQCRNSGGVNTTEVKATVELEDLDWSQLNSTENAPTSTDIGGVAGFSAGILQSCRNEGVVGYEHVGYNVGGVVGRQSGYLDGCVNAGAVYGRKDVGGVAGQLEPDLRLQYNEDALNRLWSELDTLQSLMEGTLNHAGDSSGALTSSIDRLTDRTRTVKDRTGDLTDAVTGWANGNIDVINDMSARVSWTLDQMDPVLDGASDAMEDFSDSFQALEEALAAGELAAAFGQDAVENLERAAKRAAAAFSQAQAALAEVDTHALALLAALRSGDEDAMSAAARDLAGDLEALSDAAGTLKTAADALEAAMGNLERAGSHGQDLLKHLRDAMDPLSAAADTLSDAAEDLRKTIRELADKPAIEFRPLDSDLTARGDDLEDALSSLLDGMDDLNSTVRTASDTLLDDLRAINRQLGVVVDVLRDAAEDSGGGELEDRFEDVSDQDAASDTGLISGSRNTGTVRGDVNVAGIAGSVAVEYDFDPEDDLTIGGERSLDFRYQARAVIRGCVNQGSVTAKKDCAGGITGRMDLGRVSACESYGPVVSTDGDYVGGVTGASYAVIRDCWAKCRLSGGDYVGGVAGYGDTILNCRALVVLDEATEYLGAVAGDVDPAGRLQGNLFVQETVAGVDGVSYAGKAEPVDFADLERLGNMPAAFARFELVFLADGRTVATIPFAYGDSLESLPDIPAKAGCSGKWPAIDLTRLTFSQTLEAVYTPYASALSGGGGDQPELLVDGSFSEDAVISHTAAPAAWTDGRGMTRTGVAYTVLVTDPALETISYTIHYRLPEKSSRYNLWVQAESGWEERPLELDGSYLLLESAGPQTTFCLVERGVGLWGWLLAAAAALAVGGVALWNRKKRRASGRQPGGTVKS